MSDTLPATVNLTAYRGDSWSQKFRFLIGSTPVDVASATVEAEARGRGQTRHALVVDVTGTVVTISLPDPSPPPGTYEYDVEVTLDGDVRTWVAGSLRITRDVTNEQPA